MINHYQGLEIIRQIFLIHFVINPYLGFAE